MENNGLDNGWELDFNFPIGGRTNKPRSCGITMVIDKGLGLNETRDLMEIGANYIDLLKLGFGTSALYRPEILHKKIKLVHAYDVEIYPGGTFLEIALVQGKVESYLWRAKELGFNVLEVSDGTVNVPARQRSAIIKKAREMGFRVYTEIGKKDNKEIFDTDVMVQQLKRDLDDGAEKVIIEARESGTGVSIFDEMGNINYIKMEKILSSVKEEADHIMWEAPLKKQQVEFIKHLGNNVNLGNIPPSEVLALESLCVGLRNDTFKMVINNKELFPYYLGGFQEDIVKSG